MDDDEISLTSTQPSVHSDSSEFEIDEIVGKRKAKHGLEYLVRWLGYDDSRASWEPSNVFANRAALKEWERDNKALDPEQQRQRIEAIQNAIDAAEQRSRWRKERRQQLRDQQSVKQAKERVSPLPVKEHEKRKSAEVEDTQFPSEMSNFKKKLDRNLLKRKHRDSSTGDSSPNEERSESVNSSLPTRKKPQKEPQKTPPKESEQIVAQEITTAPSEPVKRPVSAPHIPKYLSGGKSTHFRNYMTQNRVRKISSAEPAPDKAALKLTAVDKMDEEMEKAHAQRAADPLGLNTIYETVGDRRRAREAIKAQIISPEDPLSPDKATETARKRDLDMHIMPALSFNQPRSSAPDRIDLANGRFWYRGEMLVNLSFDKNTIGDVRFHGFDNASRATLMHMKTRHVIPLNARDVWDKQTYTNVCYGKSNEIFSKGCVIGFDDNESSVREMANFLQYNNCVALIWHPNKECVYIFYSIHSPDWNFFENASSNLSNEHELRVICRSYFEDLPSPPPMDIHETLTGLASNISDNNNSPLNRQASDAEDGIQQPQQAQLGKSLQPTQDPRLRPKEVDTHGRKSPPNQSQDKFLPKAQNEVKKIPVSFNIESLVNKPPPPSELQVIENKTTDPRLRLREQKTESISTENERTPLKSHSNPHKSMEINPEGTQQANVRETIAPKQQENYTSKPDGDSASRPQPADAHAHPIQNSRMAKFDPPPYKVSESRNMAATPNSDTLMDHIYRTAIQWPGIQQSSIGCYVFYLLFPEQQKRQLEQIEEYIDKQPTTNFVFHETQPTNKTFSKFSTLIRNTGNSLGVVLMHTAKRDFVALPQLASLLKGSSQVPKAKAKSLPKLNIFAVSLNRPIFDLASAGHLQRLFPHFGVCILLTEGAMRKQASDALSILRWFDDWRRKKPNWKICLRPRVRPWLNEMARSDKDTTRRRLMLEMLKTINNIIPDSSINYGDVLLTPSTNEDGYESIGNDGDSDDEGNSDPLISVSRLKRYGQPPSNPEVSQLTKDEHVLVEWFAGWAYKKVTKHRCFTAVTTESLKDWAAWNHIEIISPAKFMEDLGIEADEGNAKIKGIKNA